MTAIEWGVIISIGMFLLAFAGFVFRIAKRISDAETKADVAASRADVAGLNVAANTLRVETVARLLSEHKETAARDYVSNVHMTALENRLVDAIQRLGDRIDGLFSRAASA